MVHSYKETCSIPTSTYTTFTKLFRQHVFLVKAPKVVNDLLPSLYKCNIFIQALLEFSSAFDTIDHSFLAVSVLTLDLLMPFTDCFYLFVLIEFTNFHYVNIFSALALVYSGGHQRAVLCPTSIFLYIMSLSTITDPHIVAQN